MLPCGITAASPRTSLLIRLSHEDAVRIREEAALEYRSLSGHLLFVLDRSIWIEEKVAHGARVKTDGEPGRTRTSNPLLNPGMSQYRIMWLFPVSSMSV
jgi:hypothetical protein